LITSCWDTRRGEEGVKARQKKGFQSFRYSVRQKTKLLGRV